MTPPSQTVYVVRKGDQGVVAWAVQRGLNSISAVLVEDGVYGSLTRQAVVRFQRSKGLDEDGVFGPATSQALAASLVSMVGITVPDGLIWGVVLGESNGLIGAVNWSVPGGVDCGYLQRRVYSADYGNQDVERRAFDGLYQAGLLARSLRERHDAFYGRTGAKTHEAAWRLATLNHNYPSGADTISKNGVGGLSSYWTTEQSWVTAIGARFPDGVSIRTPLEWCRHYALGSDEHAEPGMMTKYVTSWT